MESELGVTVRRSRSYFALLARLEEFHRKFWKTHLMFLDPRTCDLIPPLPMYWTMSYCLSALFIVNVTSYWLFKRTLLQSYPYVWIRTVWSLQSTKCPCDLDSASTIHHLHRFDRHSSSSPIFLHLLGISIGVHTFIVTIALRWYLTSRTLSWKPSFFSDTYSSGHTSADNLLLCTSIFNEL